jgi:hypothetical protein
MQPEQRSHCCHAYCRPSVQLPNFGHCVRQAALHRQCSTQRRPAITQLHCSCTSTEWTQQVASSNRAAATLKPDIRLCSAHCNNPTEETDTNLSCMLTCCTETAATPMQSSMLVHCKPTASSCKQRPPQRSPLRKHPCCSTTAMQSCHEHLAGLNVRHTAGFTLAPDAKTRSACTVKLHFRAQPTPASHT